MSFRSHKYRHITLSFIFLIIVSNYFLYLPFVQQHFMNEMDIRIVWGSIIDLVILVPILLFATFQIGWKHSLVASMLGLVWIKWIIPFEFHEYINPILVTGIAAEGLFVLSEIALLVWMVWKIPKIRQSISKSQTELLYNAIPSVIKETKDHIILRLFTMEWLTIYYGLFTFRKKTPMHAGVFTMHKTTSALAMQIMLIHAFVIETVAFHWYLHSENPALSYFLLVLNLYGLIYVIANLQIMRLAPLEIRNNTLTMSQGLAKSVQIALNNIQEIKHNEASAENIEIIMYRDFEERKPELILILKEEVPLYMAFGRKKMVKKLAFSVDDPHKFLAHWNNHLQVRM